MPLIDLAIELLELARVLLLKNSRINCSNQAIANELHQLWSSGVL